MRLKQASKHTHSRAQCSHASVGLTQACPNNPCRTHTGSFEVTNNIALTVTLCLRRSVSLKGTDRIMHMLQCLAGMDECMDNSCKQRAEYLRRSLVIIYTERDEWQASFIWETSVCFAEVSVTEHILRKFPNSQKS